MSITLTNMPTLVVEIAFTTNPAASPSWTDVSGYVRSLSIRRGRKHELGRIEAGTCNLVLNNRDRRFDPSYASGAYYPNVLPLRKIRVRATWSSTTYDLFTGYVEGWPQKWSGPKDSYVSVTAVDGFEPLNQATFTTSFALEGAGARITKVLDAISWSATDRDIDTGASEVIAEDVEEVSALQHISDVAESELGYFFMSRDGKATFHSRHRRLKTPYTTSQGTFGENAGELPYVDITVNYDKEQIKNYVAITPEGQTAQIAQDATSQAKYFRRTFQRTPKITHDYEAADMAQYLLDLYKNPALHIESITLSPRMATGLWPHALGREIGDRITVKRRPYVGTVISGDYHIEGATHDLTNSTNGWSWKTTWNLSPASTASYWILGTSSLGVDTKLAY